MKSCAGQGTKEMENQIEAILRGGQFKRIMENQLSVIKQRYGLKRIEIEILYFLSQCGESNTSTDIRRHLEMNKGHISQAVERLCCQGYINAIHDREDRRYVHYAVTGKAELVTREMTEIWKNMTMKIFEGISEEELMVFKQVAHKIENNMNELLGQ